mmetsp:Transcript_2539/g.5415  ORF Transcript_2539/g.5415 Transcript_2539/m.5415 type:complete len:309 (-) Transcript_2539:123-1049(-)
MGGGSAAKEHPLEYLAASALAASINYPLWRASAIGQAGFRVTANAVPGAVSGLVQAVPPSVAPFFYAFAPPYKGMTAVISGMTWARAAIFWGSDRGKEVLMHTFPNAPTSFHTILPPLAVSTAVQCVNQPIVRASITLQNPESNLSNTRAAIRHIYQTHGLGGLWHGTSAGILKTVPKYCTAIIVKDYMETLLPPADPTSPSYNTDVLFRSACKSMAAGIAGAALTNPMDVIRNEMFKENKSLIATVKSLREELGWKFMGRGIGKNMVAVAVPIACTIFFTDALIQLKTSRRSSSVVEQQNVEDGALQ